MFCVTFLPPAESMQVIDTVSAPLVIDDAVAAIVTCDPETVGISVRPLDVAGVMLQVTVPNTLPS